MPESESASKVLHRVNPGADSQQRHQLLALITDSFFISIFTSLTDPERGVCLGNYGTSLEGSIFLLICINDLGQVT